jgi:peptide/nickel transport system substrate-binding protein
MINARTLVGAVAALPLILVTACSGEPASTPGNEDAVGGTQGTAAADDREAGAGGDLVVALSEEPDALDPTLARTFVGRIVFANLCESLYTANEDLEVVPQLAAELPEVSEEGTTVTIPLREGVKFTDGTDLDAEAVKTTIERHKSLTGSARTAELAPVESVEVVDPLTVQLNLTEPFAPLTAVLADRAGMIMSPTQLEELGEDFAQEPVCVGPFQFVERRAGAVIVLERAAEYYDADSVKLDQVTFSIIAQGPVRAGNLRSGEVDVAERLDTTSLNEIEADSNLKLMQATSIGYQGITINVGNVAGVNEPFGEREVPIAQDPRIREAFELSLDLEAINEVVFNGRYQPGCGPLPPASPYYPTDLECTGGDVEQAQALLEEAGVQTPVPISLMLSTDPVTLRLGQVIQEMTKEAGFKVDVEPTEFVTSLDLADQGDFDTFQIGWSGRIDPDGNIFDFHHTEGALNYSGVHDEEVDQLLVAARTATDMAERQELYAEALDLIHERRNIVYLYHEVYFTGTKADVVGLDFFGDGLLRLKSAGFAE